MTLIKHHPRYWSKRWEVAENTYILNSDRYLYAGGPGIKGKIIGKKIPKGTLIRCDDLEVDKEQGYRRVYYFADKTGYAPISGYFPEEIVAILQEMWPNAPEQWDLWLDWSGTSTWPVPVVPTPEPEPTPVNLDKVIVELAIDWENRVITPKVIG